MLLKKTRFGDLRRSTFEADVEEQEFRLATQPATGTVRSRRTRSTCQYRLSEGRINRFAVAGQPSRVCGRDGGSGTRHHTPSHFRLLLAFLRDWDVTGRPDRSHL